VKQKLIPSANYVFGKGTDDSAPKGGRRNANVSVGIFGVMLRLNVKGICPNVEGEFVPFLHYLDINGSNTIPAYFEHQKQVLRGF
jgi:hypothetical protein